MSAPTRSQPTNQRAYLLRLDSIDGYRLILFLLIFLYSSLFTWLAFAQHDGMRTHKADLGQIAQAVWNTSRGRFVEMTDNGYISTRMSDHVEPILAVISPIFWLWNDIRSLLLLQALLVALGAWPLYELSLLLFDHTLPPPARTYIWEIEPLRQWTRPLALALVIGYLLAPQLQSALLTEFHAAPLAVPLILWAFWAVEARRRLQFTFAVLLLAMVKEETALLAALLGLWAIWRITVVSRWDADPQQGVWRGVLLGGALAVFSLLWFYLATFVIVPAHAVQVYGVNESTYFQRYGALGNSPIDILRSFVTQPVVVWRIATEPARLIYLRSLLIPFGWLSLLAPEVLLLGAPILMANQLSAYPAQYYGDFHYSAPVFAYFAAAAAFGMMRLWRWTAPRLNQSSASFQHLPAASAPTMAVVALLRNSRTSLRPLLVFFLVVWTVGWAVNSYVTAGRGPGGARYDPTPITAHDKLLSRFITQIPTDAAVTATAAVHPHLSNRRFVYQFPIGVQPPGNADWAVIDVTTATDMAPGDVRTEVEQMLAGEWGVVDGADGFLLLHKGGSQKQIPSAFYDFVRSTNAVKGALPLPLSPLTLVKATVDDWPRWRATELSMLWQVGDSFDAATMSPSLEIRTPSGETLYDLDHTLSPALVWYPPQRWQAGDQVRVTTSPLYLPRAFGVVVERTPGLAVLPAGVSNDQSQLVAAFGRTGDDRLTALETTPVSTTQSLDAWLQGMSAITSKPVTAHFVLQDAKALTLTATLASNQIWPGATVDARLAWQGAPTNTWPSEVSAFVHLRQAGTNENQEDGLTRYFVLDPQPIAGNWADWRQLTAPMTTTASLGDKWQVVVGLYDPATGKRMPVVDGIGNLSADEVVVGTLTWRDVPVADQACALIPATCVAQVEEYK